MSESEVVKRTSEAATVSTLLRDLRAFGVAEGDVLIVHSSLNAIGWVAGGAVAVIDALMSAVGPEGTISMPSHSGDWSDPSLWENPAVPSDWWGVIESERPAFDPYATPLRGMGAVAENLLLRRSTLRSSHPLHSHMANGRHAELIVRDHPLADSFGDGSPLGRLYQLDAKVLLLGVGHGSNTSLHLAEARARWAGKRPFEFRSTVKVDGRPTVVTWFADDPDASDFEMLGEHLDASGLVRTAHVGQAVSRSASMRSLVDLALPWLEAQR